MQSAFDCVSWCCCRMEGSPRLLLGWRRQFRILECTTLHGLKTGGCICMPKVLRVICLAICLWPHLTVSSVARGGSCWQPQLVHWFAGVRQSLLYGWSSNCGRSRRGLCLWIGDRCRLWSCGGCYSGKWCSSRRSAGLGWLLWWLMVMLRSTWRSSRPRQEGTWLGPFLVQKGLIMSIPYFENDHGEETWWSSSWCMCVIGSCFWHWMHFLTYVVQSSSIIGQ